MPLTPEQIRAELIAKGLNPDDFDFDNIIPPPPPVNNQPRSFGRLEAAKAVGKRSIVPTLAGGLAAAGGAALLPSGVGTLPGLGLIALSGLGGGALGSYAQEKVLQRTQSPADYAAGQKDIARAHEQYPVQSFLTGAAPSLLMGRPSISGTKNLIGGLRAGRGATEIQRQAMTRGAIDAGVNAGQDVASQLLLEDGEFSPGRVAGSALLGAAFNKPWLLGKTRAFGFRPQQEQTQPTSEGFKSTAEPISSMDFWAAEGNEYAAQPWTLQDDQGNYYISQRQVDETIKRLYPQLAERHKVEAGTPRDLNYFVGLSPEDKRTMLQAHMGNVAPDHDVPGAGPYNRFTDQKQFDLDQKLATAEEAKRPSKPYGLPTPKAPGELRTAEEVAMRRAGVRLKPATPSTPLQPSQKLTSTQLPEAGIRVPIGPTPIKGLGFGPLVPGVKKVSPPLPAPKVVNPKPEILTAPKQLKAPIDVTSPLAPEIKPPAITDPPPVKPLLPVGGEPEPPPIKVDVEIKKAFPPKAPEVVAQEKKNADLSFEQLGPGHATFSQQLDNLTKNDRLGAERAAIIKEVLRDVDDNLFFNLNVETGTRKGALADAWRVKDWKGKLTNLRIRMHYKNKTIENKLNFGAGDVAEDNLVSFFHEFGHIADYALLTKDERDLITSIYRKMSQSPEGLKAYFRNGWTETASRAEYFASSPTEFFAQSFADYVMGNKISEEKLRPIFDRVWDRLKKAVARYLGRTGWDEANQLNPIFEKILSGQSKYQEIPGPALQNKAGLAKGTEHTEPQATISDDVLRMSPTEFANRFRGGDMTKEAINFGRSVKTPEQIDALRQQYQEAYKQYNDLISQGKIEDAVLINTKPQFFREAYEAATGTGSGKDTALELDPKYEAPVKDYDFGRGLKEQEDFEPSDTIAGIESESKRTLPLFRSAIEEVRRLGPTGKMVAPAMENFYRLFSRYEGQYVYPIAKALTKDISLFKNPTDWVKMDNKTNQRVNQYRDDIHDFGKSDIVLTPEEQRMSDSIQQFLRKVGDDQVAKGIPVVDAQGHPRTRGFDPTYHPQVVDNEVINTIINNPEKFEAVKLKGDYIKYQIEQARRNGEVLTEDQAKQRLNEVLESFSGDTGVNTASQYGPIDKTEGFGIPSSWREKNLVNRLTRYSRRVARRFAYFDSIEKSPEIRAALGIKRDVFGNPTPNIPGVEPISADVVKVVMRNIQGQTNRAELKRDAVAGVVRAAMLGTGTGAVDFTSNLALGFQHFTPSQTVRSALDAWKNMSKNLADSFASGVNRLNIGSLETNAAGAQEVVSALHRFRDIINVVQGRNFLEQMTRATAFGQGRFVAMDNLVAASKNKANKQQIKFLNDFAPGWEQYKASGEFPADALNEAAARYVESVQGTYDFRGLPAIAVEGSLAPFLSLSRWNIEKANNFYKFVVNPAMDGNYTPLLMSTIGMILGGSAVKEIRELMSGKKEKVPEVKEIAATNKANPDAWFYKAAALADASGYAGMLGSLARMVADVKHKNPIHGFTSPLIHATQESWSTVADAVQAFEDGDFNLGLDTLSKVIEDNVQTYRIILSQAAKVSPEAFKDKSEEIDRSNKLRDLRTYKQLTGQPVSNITSERPNRFANRDIRDYKRSGDLKESRQILREKILPSIKKEPSLSQRVAGLQSLKRNSYQTVPSPSRQPLEFARYNRYIRATKGEASQQELLADYRRQNRINRMKNQLLPKSL